MANEDVSGAAGPWEQFQGQQPAAAAQPADSGGGESGDDKTPPWERYAAANPQPAEAPASPYPVWDKIAGSDGFKKRPAAEQQKARDEYFYSKILPQAATPDAPQDVLARNQPWAKPAPSGGYHTQLEPQQEQQFQQWADQHHVPLDDSPTADYDMRGFYQALQSGDPRAHGAIDPNDGRFHFPDTWKTPYHHTFSAESQWATPDAPKWKDNTQLVDKAGKVIFDDRLGMDPARAERAYVEFNKHNPTQYGAGEAVQAQGKDLWNSIERQKSGISLLFEDERIKPGDNYRAALVRKYLKDPQSVPIEGRRWAEQYVDQTMKKLQDPDSDYNKALARNHKLALEHGDIEQYMTPSQKAVAGIATSLPQFAAAAAAGAAAGPGAGASYWSLQSAADAYADARAQNLPPDAALGKAEVAMVANGALFPVAEAVGGKAGAAITSKIAGKAAAERLVAGGIASTLRERIAQQAGHYASSGTTMAGLGGGQAGADEAYDQYLSGKIDYAKLAEKVGAGAADGFVSGLMIHGAGQAAGKLSAAPETLSKALAARVIRRDIQAGRGPDGSDAPAADAKPGGGASLDELLPVKPPRRRPPGAAPAPTAEPEKINIAAPVEPEPAAGRPPTEPAEPATAAALSQAEAVEPAAGRPGASTVPHGTITPEAQAFLDKVDKGAVPAFISKNLRRIAAENGVEVGADSTPNSIVAALRQRTAGTQAPEAGTKPAEAGTTATAADATPGAADATLPPESATPGAETVNRDGLPVRTGENVGLAAAMADDGRTSLHDKNLPDLIEATHTDPDTGARSKRPFSLLESRDHHERVEDAEMQAGKTYDEAHRVATEAEHARMRQLGFDPNELERLHSPYIDAAAHEARARGNTTPEAGTEPYRTSGEAGMRQDGEAPDNRFVLDRDGNKYTTPVHGKLLKAFEVVTAQGEDGEHAVIDANSGKVLAVGKTAEMADAAAAEFAEAKGRIRLKKILDKEPPLSQQQLRERYKDKHPEARIGTAAVEPAPPSRPERPLATGAQKDLYDLRFKQRHPQFMPLAEYLERVKSHEIAFEEGKADTPQKKAAARRRADRDFDRNVWAEVHHAAVEKALAAGKETYRDVANDYPELTTTPPQEKENATVQRKKSEGREQEHPGAAPGPAVRQDEAQPRRGDGEPAGGGSGAEGSRAEQADGDAQPAGGEEKSPVAAKPKRRREPFADPRIQSAPHRAELERMADHAGWAQIGGQMLRDTSGIQGGESDNFGVGGMHGQGDVVGRTAWVPNEPWFADVQRGSGLPGNTDGRATREAVRKALAGEPLTVRQTRHIEALLDEADARRNEEMAFHEEGINPTEEQVGDAALVQHAIAIDESAVEKASVQFEDDYPAFMAEDRRITDGHHQKTAEADAAPAGEDRQAGPGTAGGAVQAPGDQRAQDAEDRPAQRAGGGVAEPGPDDFELEGHSPADLKARAEAARTRADAEQRARADAESRARADRELTTFTLTGSDRPADQAASAGQLSLFSAAGAKPIEAPKPQAPQAKFWRAVKSVRTGTFRTGIDRVRTPEDAAHIFAPLRREAQESLLALVTDRDGKPLGVIRHVIGTTRSADAQRPILLGAIHNVPGAAKVWMAHNHPSGKAEHSLADARLFHNIDELLRGTGVEYQGSVVVAPGGKATFLQPGADQSGDIKVTPAARTGEVPLLGRQFRQLAGDRPGQINSVTDGKALLAKMPDPAGVLLLDTQHMPVGWVPMTPAEMGKLRTGSSDSGAGRLLAAAERANSENLIVKLGENDDAAAQNLGTFARDTGMKVLDTIMNGRSMAELGRSPNHGGPYYSLDADQEKQTETPAFKEWFSDSKVVDKDGKPKVVYHGAKRPDRIGDRFRKSRATSGPMSFFTEDPAIASNYATGKDDTSLETPADYAEWFKYKPKGARSEVDVDRMWYHLTPEERAKIAQTLPHVVNVDEAGNEQNGYRLGGENEYGLSGADHWNHYIKQSRGNVLQAAKEIWLNGGNLYGSEHEFMDVLRKGGVPMDRLRFDHPHAEYPAVLPAYLKIRNPLDTAKISPEVLSTLKRAAARSRTKPAEYGADMWDKRKRDLREWVQQLKQDIAKGENSHVWTSIPDQITQALKGLGYDGIKDVGGKLGGESHPVWVPFEENQIKSAVGNRGTFDSSPRLTYDIGEPSGKPGQSVGSAKAAKDAEPASTDDLARKLTASMGRKISVRAVGAPDTAARGMASAVKRLFGRDVVFIKTDAPAAMRGVHIGGNKLYVNVDANRSHAQIAGHELLHSIREEQPDIYNRLMADLRPALNGAEAGEFRDRLNARRSSMGLPPLPEGQMHEEVVAEVVGDHLADPAFLRELRQRLEPNVFRRLLAHIAQWIDKVRGRISGTPRDMGAQASRFVSDLEAAREAVHKALQEVAEGQQHGSDEREAAPAYSNAADTSGDALFSHAGAADPFYSALTRSAEQMKGAPRSADATSWKQWLDGAQRRGEFKQEERNWMGLDQWLDAQGGKVTREQLQDFVRANQVKVQEVEKGGGKAEVRQEGGGFALYDDGQFVEHYDTSEEAQQAVAALGKVGGSPETKFNKYQLPGGTNYREHLLTLPSRVAPREQEVTVKLDRTAPSGDRIYSWSTPDGDSGIHRAGPDSTLEGVRHQVLIKLDTDAVHRVGQDFTSGHWDEPNVLAHVRTNDRTGPNGEKILHVEEIQSDWHQKGRKQGYGSKPAWKVIEKDGSTWYNSHTDKKSAEDEAEQIGGTVEPYQTENTTPDAPFKTSWPLLAMKRMIRKAAEEGYDKITWTPGDAQADRYDLSKQLSRIRLTDNNSGGIGRARLEGPFEHGSVEAFDKSGKQVIDRHVRSEQEMADLIGKEAAERILKAEAKHGSSAGIGVRERELRGLDLKVGGEGMKGFYDKILPAEVGKYIKKWGGKVGPTELAHEPTGSEDPDTTPINDDGEVTTKVPGFDITPQMRESAMEGQPMFSLGDRHDDEPKVRAAASYYGTPGARELAHKVKAGDPAAIEKMAKDMAPMASKDSVLIPLPSRTGRATVTLDLANRIAELSGAKVADVLRGNKRESLYEAKKSGGAPDLLMRTEGDIPAGKRLLVDTVHATGQTASAAAKAVPGAELLVHSQDQTAAPAFRRWFGDSKVVDAQGKPLVVYRGEHGEGGGDVQSRLGSISFGSAEAASQYAEQPNNRALDKSAAAPRVTPAFLRIEKPLVNDAEDPFIDFSKLTEAVGQKNAEQLALRFADHIQNTNNWEESFSHEFKSVADLVKKAPERLGELYVDAYPLLDDPAAVKMFKDAGYDGAIHGGNGETSMEPEYRVFDHSQIKSAIGNRGTFNPTDPRINYSLDADPEDATGAKALAAKLLEQKRAREAAGAAGDPIEARLERQRALEGLRAAMRDPETGKVYTGASHQAAIDKVPPGDTSGAWGRLSSEWDQATDNSGFVDRDGKFISRTEAEKRWGVSTIEDVRDARRKMDSRLRFSLDETPEPADERKDTEPPEVRSGKDRDPTSPIGRARNFVDATFGELYRAMNPMSAGSDRAQAMAKDYANADRLAHKRFEMLDDKLQKEFTPEQRELMGQALDEHSVLVQQGLPTDGKGLDRLAPKMREMVERLNDYGRQLWQRAQDVGMVQGEGIPYWMPRMLVQVDDQGRVSRLGGDGGRNVERGARMVTTSPNTKRRNHLLAADTEAAAKAKFGEATQLVTDIRAMPLAMQRLERAIAGRELINGIKDIGKEMGLATTSDSAEPGYFTLNHPAFEHFRPRLVQDKDTGKLTAAVDQNGDTQFDRVPIYVSKEFEGPLRSLMWSQPGKVEKALMQIKAESTGLVMYSPFIHLGVEFGRAFPALPGKMLTLKFWRDGEMARKDYPTLSEAINNGLVPIGKRAAYQDLTSIASEDPQIHPGQGIISKAIGAAVDKVGGKDAGDRVRRRLDVFGNFYHNTLLWDRVGQLQMGLYLNMKQAAMRKGLDERTAGIFAAHEANRFAGTLPREAMSQNSTRIGNLLLFSRQFTMGNLGVLKDAISGMPSDVQAQISRDSGALMRKAANSLARRKAIATIVLDVGLLYAGNSLMQDYFRKRMGDKDEGGYARRFHAMMQDAGEHPFHLMNPFYIPERLSSTWDNEPGKQDRILVGHEKDGTAIYMRTPFGKVGEDFKNWITSPLDTLKRKEGTIARPVLELLSNDRGFGRRVYDPNMKDFGDVAKNIGSIVGTFMSSMTPLDVAKSAVHMIDGTAKRTDAAKALGPFFGLTFSKGAPGGPQVGEILAQEAEHRARMADELPEVNKLIDAGKTDEAQQKLVALGMNPRQAAFHIRDRQYHIVSRGRMRQFMSNATPEQNSAFQRQNAAQAIREQQERVAAPAEQ